METTNTKKSTALMTMDEFLEYLETRGSRNTTSQCWHENRRISTGRGST